MADAFGDAEPEDAWAPDDPLPELVRNLIRRRARDRTAQVGEPLQRIRRDMFDEDLAWILERVVAELDGA